MHEIFICAPKKKIKNNNQEVYYLNPWEFQTLWEIKLLPADESAVAKLAKRSVRASLKNLSLGPRQSIRTKERDIYI